MKSNSLETEYVSFSTSLQTSVTELMASVPLVRGFWERWCKEHRLAARKLSANQEFPALNINTNEIWTDFLKHRQRMVSTLGQGLKASPQDSMDIRMRINNLLREHDSGFIRLLQRELETVKEQMSHAFTLRKTVTAYAQTAQYRGE